MWSEWHALKSDGSIPDDLLPCSEWQIRHFIDWRYDILSDMGFANLSSEWGWSIGTGGVDVFVQQVRIGGSLTWFGSSVFGLSAEMFTWWYNSAAEHVVTTTPVKPPILGADPDAWKEEAETGHWHNPAEQGYAWDDAAKPLDLTDRTVIINFWYQGPIYQIPLGAGSTMGFWFVHRGVTWPRKWADCQIRTKRASILAVRDPAQGVCWTADRVSDGMKISSLVGKNVGPFSSRIGTTSAGIALLRSRPSMKLHLLCQGSDGAELYTSNAEGQGSWTLATISGVAQPVTACVSEDGGMLYLLGRSGSGMRMYHVPLAASGAALAALDKGAAQGLPSNLSGAYLADQHGRLHLVVSGATGAEYYHSVNGGVTWI